MDIFEFLSELQTFASRSDINSTKPAIRLYDKESRCYCPITAVLMHKKNTYNDISDFDIAGRNLGLNNDDIFTVLNNADSFAYSHNIRQTLLNACGLGE